MDEFQRHILAATGYLQLGMLGDAANELEEISPEHKTRPEVLAVRLELYHAAAKWDAMAVAARVLAKAQPERADWWIQLGYATRRAESLAAARDVLIEAQKHHPKNATIMFNLACYSCHLGDLAAAKRYVGEAITRDGTLRAMALDDPDLEPLWHSLG